MGVGWAVGLLKRDLRKLPGMMVMSHIVTEVGHGVCIGNRYHSWIVHLRLVNFIVHKCYPIFG